MRNISAPHPKARTRTASPQRFRRRLLRLSIGRVRLMRLVRISPSKRLHAAHPVAVRGIVAPPSLSQHWMFVLIGALRCISSFLIALADGAHCHPRPELRTRFYLVAALHRSAHEDQNSDEARGNSVRRIFILNAGIFVLMVGHDRSAERGLYAATAVGAPTGHHGLACPVPAGSRCARPLPSRFG